MPAKAVVQRIPAQGGWVNGDAAFEGPNPPGEAQIVYYQKKRHIFGDLTIEVLGPDGKVLDNIPSSKRRGLSRAAWSMRLKPPRVPTAANAAGGTFGPRVLPGTYTVKMTKDKNVYETKLVVVPDPRSKHTPEDRKAQFDLAMKLYRSLGDMTFAVDRINGVRAALEERAGKLPAGDPLAAQPPRRLHAGRRAAQEDRRHDRGRRDHRRGAPARVPDVALRQRRLLRGAAVADAGRARLGPVARARATSSRTSTPGPRRSCPG